MTATTTRTRPAAAAIRLVGSFALPSLTLVLVLVAPPTPSRGGPIGPGFNLSAAEAKHPMLLASDGRQIRVFKGARGATVVRPSGASPAYVAFRLRRPSELPAGYPTVNVGGRAPHSGPARGPLRLDALAKSALDAELAKTGAAAVHMPRQTFVVESLSAMLSTSSSDPSAQVWLAPTAATAGGSVAQPAISGSSSVLDTIKGWINSGTTALQNLNTTITDTIQKQLKLATPKAVIYPPLKKKTKTAAEVLIPPGVGAVQPAPVPEPASLVVFAVALAAAAARVRNRAGSRRRP